MPWEHLNKAWHHHAQVMSLMLLGSVSRMNGVRVTGGIGICTAECGPWRDGVKMWPILAARTAVFAIGNHFHPIPYLPG
jgi:hypothetical protein